MAWLDDEMLRSEVSCAKPLNVSSSSGGSIDIADALGRTMADADPATFLPLAFAETAVDGFGLRQQLFSLPSSSVCGLLTLRVVFGTGAVVAVVGAGFVRRVRLLSGDAINRFTVGGLGLFGVPLTGLRSEEPPRKRVLFRASVEDVPVTVLDDDVEAVTVLAGNLNAFAALTGDFLFAHDAADAGATADILDSFRRGRGSGRTLRSCIADHEEAAKIYQ